MRFPRTRTILATATLALGAGAVWIWQRSHDISAIPSAPTSAVVALEPRELVIASPDGSVRPLDLRPDRLRAIVAEPLAIQERLQALHADQRAPDDSEQKALIVFVESQTIPAALSRGSWHHLVNDIWNVLARAEPTNFEKHLRTMARESLDPVIRDYALQHLAHQADRPTNLTVRTLKEGLQSTEGTLAGTSLLGLASLAAKATDSAGKESLEQSTRAHALRLALDRSASAPSRITALSLCVDLKETSVLPEARHLVADPATEPQLLLVAVRVIGTLGDASDQQLLEELRPRSQHPVLFQAIDHAASQLNSAKGI